MPPRSQPQEADVVILNPLTGELVELPAPPPKPSSEPAA